jgi:putative ABC transport system substrate-binding protein
MPGAIEAQPAGKVWKIGFLGSGTAAAWKSGVEALQRGLSDHGYVEGRNVRIEYRWAENRYDRLPGLAVDLVQLKPDVIITHGTPSTLALKRATSTIPIVMSIIGNPVENGVVASLARPGGNITGASFFSDEITAKRLEIMKTGYPAVARVAFLGNTANVAGHGTLRAMEAVRQSHNVELQLVDVRHPDDLESALTALAKARSHGVVLADEQVVTTGDAPRRIAEFSLQNRLPSIGPVAYARAGGLIGYGVVWTDVVRESMAFVDAILKGANPATLPIQQATTFELVLNVKTANALGLAIPPSLLARANHVIQ